MFRVFLFSIFILFNSSVFSQNAVYSLDFISNWNSSTHPIDYPNPARWSHHLVGATHNSDISFWKIGQIATDGVELFAETGEISIFSAEVNTAISNVTAFEFIDLATSTEPLMSFEGAITVDSEFPYISLMTMIAPSPDWLGEINSLKLTDDLDNWKTSVSIDVYATDAGTDNGTTYTSLDSDTDPREIISNLEGSFPFSDQIVATFVFTLDQVLGVSDHLLQNEISISPNPCHGKILIRNTGNSVLETAEIYAITGKKVKTFNNIGNKKSLVFNSLQSGVYFLKINSDKGSITKKLIIQ